MAFTMHSHSGQFCPGHAKDDLEVILQTAVSKGFQSISFTEHMPRESETDLYPEETSIEPLWPMHEDFLVEAVRLRERYQGVIKVLIGFEGEWIRPSYAPIIQKLAAHQDIDYFIGSVHHVHEIPIDYDDKFYIQAQEKSGGTDESLFADYFDSQHDMLLAIHPKVIGHFDLIRLLASDSNKDRDLRTWPAIWTKVERNLRVMAEQGGLMEVNSSGLRKGLKEPYPRGEICTAFLAMGGRLTLSDDSHGIAQVGACFTGVVEFLERLDIKEVFLLGQKKGVSVLEARGVDVQHIKKSLR